MVFYLDNQNKITLHPDAIYLCEELRVLDENEVVCIVLAYDYLSPYRQFSESDRKRKAMIQTYGHDDENIFEKDKIKRAVEAYMSLQYSPKRALIETYQTKIDLLQEEIIKVGDERDITRIVKTINALRESIRGLEEEVYNEIAKEGKIVGGGELSYLEKFQRRRPAYMALLNSKNNVSGKKSDNKG